ncbi:hypothetical protein Sinac_7252 [Singulisphaera acidiphila DSM 18658]|uniref:Uncharacterized protein n=1 Tax=Singulisphaera acidiphila (strain ATCC BAA-1392 / DSM 18658 / VKM B-2454 / MOB10) TaxID=886293 RepID=L0DSB3_SINAD|nr:hypothetical protein Sinac_7252 [Singulisphaera acidiphila DSM 18658]
MAYILAIHSSRRWRASQTLVAQEDQQAPQRQKNNREDQIPHSNGEKDRRRPYNDHQCPSAEAGHFGYSSLSWR